MKRFNAAAGLLFLALWCVAILTVEQACTKAQGTTAITAGEKVAACIIGQVVSGNEDPASIASACAVTTVDEVVSVIESFLAQMPDSGTANAEFVARAQHVVMKAKAHQ